LVDVDRAPTVVGEGGVLRQTVVASREESQTSTCTVALLAGALDASAAAE
jgi:hypothetical protein